MTAAELRAVALEIEQQVYSLAQRIRQVAHELDRLAPSTDEIQTTAQAQLERDRCTTIDAKKRRCRRLAHHDGRHRFRT